MRVSGRRNTSTWPIRPGMKRSKGLNAATRIVTRMKGNVPVTTAPRASPVSHPLTRGVAIAIIRDIVLVSAIYTVLFISSEATGQV